MAITAHIAAQMFLYTHRAMGGVVVGEDLTDFSLASMGKRHKLLNAALVF